MHQSTGENTTSTASLQARIAEVFLRKVSYSLLNPKVPIPVQRQLVNLLRFAPTPRSVSCKPWKQGREGSEVHTPKYLSSPDRAVLYFHGGGFTICSPATHRALISRLAQESGLKTFASSYRLAPEHQYPAPLEDGQAAFEALIAQGYKPANIVIGGDSAGACLTLGLVQRLRESGKPLPGGLVLISPAGDMSFTQLPLPNNDAVLPSAWVRHIRWDYLSEEQWSDPQASPALADFTGFPPVLMQSSSVELLANDAKRLAQAMQRDGVQLQWQEEHGLWHDFQTQAGLVPEADAAISRLGQFIRNLA